MINLFKYNFLIFLRNRDQLIWNTLFPFVYMLIYVMAMHNLATGGLDLPTLKLALVPSQAQESELGQSQVPYKLSLQEFFSYMDDEALEADLTDQGLVAPPGHAEDQLLVLYKEAPSYEVAAQWLKDGWVYALVEENLAAAPRAEVLDRSSQIRPLVLEQILQSYGQVQQQIAIYGEAVAEGRVSVLEALAEGLKGEGFREARQLDSSSRLEALPMVNIFYFSMVAYLAFYPVNSGSFVVIATEADRSLEGVRQTVSPYSKRKRFIGNFLPYFLLILLNTLLTYLVIRLLGVNLGTYHGLILLGMGVTSLAAMLTGAGLAAFFGFSQGILIALSIALPLLFAMTSGMMSEAIYNAVQQYAPWFSNMNPVGLLSQALYHLNGGGGLPLYWQQMAKLGLYCLVAFLLTLLGLRRDSYESL